jgi:hypothetical protein
MKKKQQGDLFIDPWALGTLDQLTGIHASWPWCELLATGERTIQPIGERYYTHRGPLAILSSSRGCPPEYPENTIVAVTWAVNCRRLRLEDYRSIVPPGLDRFASPERDHFPFPDLDLWPSMFGLVLDPARTISTRGLDLRYKRRGLFFHLPIDDVLAPVLAKLQINTRGSNHANLSDHV